MESINYVINLIQPNVYMTSFDLKDAFLSETVHVGDKKFIKFNFDNSFQFACMPNGSGLAMRVFSKIKPQESKKIWVPKQKH